MLGVLYSKIWGVVSNTGVLLSNFKIDLLSRPPETEPNFIRELSSDIFKFSGSKIFTEGFEKLVCGEKLSANGLNTGSKHSAKGFRTWLENLEMKILLLGFKIEVLLGAFSVGVILST